MHLDYLKQHRRGRYSALLGEGRLNAYLADVDEQAHEMLTSLTVELAKGEASAKEKGYIDISEVEALLGVANG